MKNNSEYRILSRPCGDVCPAVLEKGNDIVVIGSLLSAEEEAAMKKGAKVGVAEYEKTVRIPRSVFEAAVEKLLTEKAST